MKLENLVSLPDNADPPSFSFRKNFVKIELSDCASQDSS